MKSGRVRIDGQPFRSRVRVAVRIVGVTRMRPIDHCSVSIVRCANWYEGSEVKKAMLMIEGRKVVGERRKGKGCENLALVNLESKAFYSYLPPFNYPAIVTQLQARNITNP